jgi:hypothetical protein
MVGDRIVEVGVAELVVVAETGAGVQDPGKLVD